MTDPTGRSFLSYRRVRHEDAIRLIQAQHERGIPTWQDIKDLGTEPTEDAIWRVLGDPSTANGILLITPEVEGSPIICKVEVPALLRRASHGDGFFLVPLAAGGLDYKAAAAVVGNGMSAHDLSTWNMMRVGEQGVNHEDAARVARRVLEQRLAAIHRQLPPDEPLRVGLFTFSAPPFVPGDALSMDWHHRFRGKVGSAQDWQDHLLPALRDVVSSVRQYAARRNIEAFGQATLPAAVALGCAFLSPAGVPAGWKQHAPDQSEQLWSLAAEQQTSGFQATIHSHDTNARDLAVLVAITADTERLFSAARQHLPPFRAILRVREPGGRRHLDSPGQAKDVALLVRDTLRSARDRYGDVGTVHLFIAGPAGLAFLIGQLLNTFGAVQTYEHVQADGSERYEAAALLHPSAC